MAASGAVLRYYLFKATEAVEFYRPVMYLYLLSVGMSFTQITVLEAAYNLMTVLGEVPTGYVGDRVGRRNSLLAGTVLIALTLAGIGLAESFPALLALWICWSLGYNFRSGSEDAWLYDTLTDDLSEDEFARVRGRGKSVAMALGVGAAVGGGYLGSIDLSYPFFAAAGVTSLGVGILLSMDEPETYEATRSDDLRMREVLSIVRRAVARRDLRSFIIYYYVAFAAVTYLVFIFLQPVFETVVVGLGVPRAQVESLLGWYYAAYSLLGAALSYYTGAIEEQVGIKRWFLVVPFIVGVLLVGSYLLPVVALVAFLLTRAVADVTRSLASHYINDRIETLGRATVLSAMAMVSGLAVIPFQIGSGVISDVTSPLFALGIGGASLVVVSGVILLWEPPVRAE